MIGLIVFVDDYQNTIEDMKIQYLASTLRRHGYECKIVLLMEKDIEKLDTLVDMEHVKMLGIAYYASNAVEAIRCADYVKKKHPDVSIVLTGDNVNKYEEKILQDNESVDVTISGEGEDVIVELADHIMKGSPTLSEIKGISYRSNNEIHTTEYRPPNANLDSYPFPDRDIHEMYPQQFLYIIGNRGCSSNCTFCSEPKNRQGACVRTRSARNIVDELKYLSQKYNWNRFYFLDPTFEDPDTGRYSRSTEIFELLIQEKLKLNLSIYSRAEVIANAPKGYYDLAKKGGLESIFVGIESGNVKDLKLYGKKATVEDNINAIKRLRKENVSHMIGFINFNPYSSYETLKQNAAFLKDTGLGHNIRLYAMRVEVYPQSPLRNLLIRDGLMSETSDYRTSVYDYKFVNKAAENLVMSLAHKNVDHIQYGIDHMIKLYENRILDSYPDLYEEFDFIFSDVRKIREEKNELFFRMFMTCLDSAFNGMSEEKLVDLVDEFNVTQYDELMRRKHLNLLKLMKKKELTNI